MTTTRCIGACQAAIAPSTPVETKVRYWSNATSWPSGKVPLAGENVNISVGQNFVFDMVESPIYKNIQINGRVTFLETAPKLHLRARYIFVRAGELIIGNATNPFKGEANITLYGGQ